MKVIYGLKGIKKFRKPVVALGVFDGVHRGHARILSSAARLAQRIKGTSVALTFDPHPQKEESLTSLEHRLRLICDLGINVCIVVNFNRSFARIPAKKFVENILVKKIGAKYIYVGKNFRFGRAAAGDIHLLRKLSRPGNFKLKVFGVIKIKKRAVSSSYIRSLIMKADLKEAEKFLGRRVSALGTVIKGDSLGSRLGFPTANINPHHEVLASSGVYAAKIILGKTNFKGACYIGTRPTIVPRSEKKRVEVYIFNFRRNIYGKYLEVQFLKKIRPDQKFATRALLAERIEKDIKFARAYFSRHS
jgi:riboflavin kinase/FMN adenylyltransferase